MRETAAKAREVVDGVVQVYLPLPMRPSIVNVYLVRAGATWTLIDTGMNTDESVAAFRGALAEVGIAPESIVRLVGTHHHVDHFGTSGPYREFTHADVYLHPLEADRVTMMAHIEGENTEYMRPNGPAHPLGDFVAAHEKVQRFEVRLVCPAHGPLYEDHRRRARQLIDFHRVRKLTMLELVRRRPMTAYEVALDAFAIAPDNRFQVMAATYETLAHLELLRREGRVLRAERDGVVVYQGR